MYEYTLCNGSPDCADGSDEDAAFCDAYNCTAGRQVTTRHSRAQQLLLPSGCPTAASPRLPHCPVHRPGSPEPLHSLGALQTKCPGGKQCMWEWGFCNGYAECADGSDEDPAYCASFDCTANGQVSQQRTQGAPVPVLRTLAALHFAACLGL